MYKFFALGVSYFPRNYRAAWIFLFGFSDIAQSSIAFSFIRLIWIRWVCILIKDHHRHHEVPTAHGDITSIVSTTVNFPTGILLLIIILFRFFPRSFEAFFLIVFIFHSLHAVCDTNSLLFKRLRLHYLHPWDYWPMIFVLLCFMINGNCINYRRIQLCWL